MKKFKLDYFSPMLFKKIKQFGPAILMTVFFVSCSSAMYIPKESSLISQEELIELRKGRALYINKCGSCHTLFLPEKYTAVQWKIQVEKMVPKTNLTSKETAEILQYVSKNDITSIKP